MIEEQDQRASEDLLKDVLKAGKTRDLGPKAVSVDQEISLSMALNRRTRVKQRYCRASPTKMQMTIIVSTMSFKRRGKTKIS